MRDHEQFKPLRELILDGKVRESVLGTVQVAEQVFLRDGHCESVILAPELNAFIAVPFTNDQEKSQAGRIMTGLARQTLTFFVAEAWMTQPMRQSEDGRYLKPSLDPERTEMVIVRVMLDKGRRDIAIAAEILRQPDSQPKLGPWIILGDTAKDGIELRKPDWKETEE